MINMNQTSLYRRDKVSEVIFYWINFCCWTIKEVDVIKDITSPTLYVSYPGTNMPKTTLQTVAIPLSLLYKYCCSRIFITSKEHNCP